jgi:hypothetical protein
LVWKVVHKAVGYLFGMVVQEELVDNSYKVVVEHIRLKDFAGHKVVSEKQTNLGKFYRNPKTQNVSARENVFLIAVAVVALVAYHDPRVAFVDRTCAKNNETWRCKEPMKQPCGL